jgi:hypothetical protein
MLAATWDQQGFVVYSSALKSLAIKLSKISSDLILLGSGPRAGLAEINLPAIQPGSSIMPGKVNPVVPEVVNLVMFRVMGNDFVVTLAAHSGQLQLNAYEPVEGVAVMESQHLLFNTSKLFRTRCIDGITVNEKVLAHYMETTIGIVTALNPGPRIRESHRARRRSAEERQGHPRDHPREESADGSPDQRPARSGQADHAGQVQVQSEVVPSQRQGNTVAEKGCGYEVVSPNRDSQRGGGVGVPERPDGDKQNRTIVILATGGTIAGAAATGTQSGYKSGACRHRHDGRRVPGITNLATIKGEQISNVGSQDMSFEILLKVAKRINELAKRPGVDGIVVTHGTDTMEESAYFLNLTVKTDKPVVMVGSMRPSTAVQRRRSAEPLQRRRRSPPIPRRRGAASWW